MKYAETEIYSHRHHQKNTFSPSGKIRTVFLILLFLIILSLLLSLVIRAKSLTLDEQKLYGVSIGDFATENTANHYATVCKARGGAGGVYKDGDKYLLFVAVYASSSDAEAVSSNLLAEGERAYVYQWKLPKVKLTFEKGAKSMIMLTEVTEIFWNTLSQLLSISLAFDKDLKSISEVVEEIQILQENTNQAISTAETLKSEETERLIKEISVGLAYQKTVLSQLEKNNLKKVDLKVAYFDLLLLNLSLREKFYA